MEKFVELDLNQRSDFTVTLTSDGITDNYSGYILESQFRKSAYTEDYHEFSAEFTENASEDTAEFTLSMSSEATANVSPGRYMFDVVATSPENFKRKLVYGIVDVYAGITRS